MDSPGRIVEDLELSNDLKPGTDVYDEIDSCLRNLVPPLGLFTFNTRSNSSSARSCADGGAKTCPVITIYFKLNEDFDAAGVNSHQGNWGDDWSETEPVRNTVNEQLIRSGFGDDFVDDQTFVFLDSVERVAFDRIGRSSKDGVAKLVSETAGERPTHIFWSSERLYTIVLTDKKDYKLVKRRAGEIEKLLSTMLKASDCDRYCRNYQVGMNLGFGDMNLLKLARED